MSEKISSPSMEMYVSGRKCMQGHEPGIVGVALRHALPGGHIVCYVRRMTNGIQSCSQLNRLPFLL